MKKMIIDPALTKISTQYMERELVGLTAKDNDKSRLREKFGNFKHKLSAQIPRRFLPFLDEELDLEYLMKLFDGEIITILGPVGAGKTTLAYRLAFQYLLILFIDKGYESERIKSKIKTADEFIFEMRSSYGNNRADEVRDSYCQSSIVMLDDLFSTMITDSVHEEVLHLINYRSSWLSPMVVTTNKTLNELAEIDARIPSRLKGGIVLELEGPDKRLQKPKS